MPQKLVPGMDQSRNSVPLTPVLLVNFIGTMGHSEFKGPVRAVSHAT